MYMNKFNLRNVVAIAICLAVTTFFSSCDNSLTVSAIDAETTVLTCDVRNITLTVRGENMASFSWSSSTNPNLSGSRQTLTVTEPATYTVIVTGTDGTTTTAQITITQDLTLPDVRIIPPITTVLAGNTTSIRLEATGGVSFVWTNNVNSEVVTGASIDVTVPAVYTVTATGENGCTATAEITIIGKTVEINGVVWATRNVGVMPFTFADNPEDFGGFFQWNNANPNLNPNWDGGNPDTLTPWSLEFDPCPEGFRLPTWAEFSSAIRRVHPNGMSTSNYRWETINEVRGVLVGQGANTMFLPASGNRHFTTEGILATGARSFYWTSSLRERGNQLDIVTFYFDTDRVTPIIFLAAGFQSTTNAFPIRCVAK